MVYVSRAAVVHLNFRTGSTFPVPVCTVPNSMDRTSRCDKVDAVRLYAWLNLLLPRGADLRGICIGYMNVYEYRYRKSYVYR